jgi:hypothetical protein
MSVTSLEEARAIHRDAREHKRLEAYHRRRARERMEELRRFCARVGIAIEYVRTEANGHGPSDEPS